jgi:hypothetical protein
VLAVTSRKVTHASTLATFGKWLIGAMLLAQQWDSVRPAECLILGVSSSGGGLFGRPVILMDPGRSLFGLTFCVR